jgi:hypothetical protein
MASLVPTLCVGTRVLDALRPVGCHARHRREASKRAFQRRSVGTRNQVQRRSQVVAHPTVLGLSSHVRYAPATIESIAPVVKTGPIILATRRNYQFGNTLCQNSTASHHRVPIIRATRSKCQSLNMLRQNRPPFGTRIRINLATRSKTQSLDMLRQYQPLFSIGFRLFERHAIT